MTTQQANREWMKPSAEGAEPEDEDRQLKRANCKHQEDDEPHCAPLYLNVYECDCGETWEDEWSCGCDDECPECGEDCSPIRSTVIGPCACEAL